MKKQKICKIFISVPMTGRDEKDVIADLDRAKEYMIDKLLTRKEWDKGLFKFEADAYKKPKLPEDPKLECLGEDIKVLGECDICFFCVGWQTSHGCKVEHAVCEEYGIMIIDEIDQRLYFHDLEDIADHPLFSSEYIKN